MATCAVPADPEELSFQRSRPDREIAPPKAGIMQCARWIVTGGRPMLGTRIIARRHGARPGGDGGDDFGRRGNTLVRPGSIRHPVVVNAALTAAGLGLDHGRVRLARTTEAWLIAGSQLRDDVERTLGTLVAGMEQIGSSAVPGLLAKPIVDLAVGPWRIATSPQSSAGWNRRDGRIEATQDMSSCLMVGHGTESPTVRIVEHDGSQ